MQKKSTHKYQSVKGIKKRAASGEEEDRMPERKERTEQSKIEKWGSVRLGFNV